MGNALFQIELPEKFLCPCTLKAPHMLFRIIKAENINAALKADKGIDDCQFLMDFADRFHLDTKLLQAGIGQIETVAILVLFPRTRKDPDRHTFRPQLLQLAE